ncbi:TonB-dependent receptor [Sphingobium chlorophenolicum L-1]|uniref:TonB-dependent receptor n=1 Tax=Sphingobium chlorophenolicum L-1 TaxID=690566 RepID=F6EZQ1_SPHCR|nr:TonB-dependent receptor [Sphingobium chlorophenolicum]AEG50235.1 TonB-dependent receptor [Sphingobium chlorophenolicum L-1]
MRLALALTTCVSVMALATAANASAADARSAPVVNTGNGQKEADTDAAQSATEITDIADIIVTASKSSAQRVVEAPLAIQAISGAQLAERNIRSADSLITAIPGASQSEQLGEFLRSYSIRGSGTGGGIGDTLVGYYLDETPYIVPNAQFAPQPRLLDLDRVEILRGPYGTLYGAGAMGGTIIYHTKNPDLNKMTVDAEAYAAATKSASKAGYGAAGAISIPIVNDRLAVRVSGGYDYRPGFADVYAGAPVGTPFKRDANSVDHRDLRVVALWRPSSDLNVKLQYQHFDGYQHYSQQMSSVKPYYFQDWGTTPAYEKTNNNLYAASIDLDAGFATLTSSTGYVDFSTSYLTSINLAFLGGVGELGNGYDGYSFSQELRLASKSGQPLHWVIGGFYNDAKNAFSQTVDFPIPILNGLGVTTTRTKNYSGFGEISYDLADGKLVPLAGIRVYHDDRNFTSVQTAAPSTSGSSSPTVVTWRANLAYHPNRDTTLYFNAGTGFRSGIVQSQLQVNALLLDNIEGRGALKPDRMRNLELGFKGMLRDANLSYEINLYDLRYQDIQSGLVTSAGVSAFASLGTAKIQGVDLALQWQPVSGLTLGISGDLNHSEYTSVNPAVARGIGPTVAVGKRILNQPRWTARADIGYTTSIGSDTNLHLNASGSFSDNRLNQFGDLTAKTAIFDGNIGIRRGPYEVEIYGQNLTNERGPWFIRQSANPSLIGPPTPRTIGLRVRLHLGD